MPGLMHSGDGAVEPCAVCGRPASGPCARCRRSVCADCVVLAHGGAGTFAVCTRCEARGGTALRSPWLGLLGWLAGIVVVLGAIGGLLYWLRH